MKKERKKGATGAVIRSPSRFHSVSRTMRSVSSGSCLGMSRQTENNRTVPPFLRSPQKTTFQRTLLRLKATRQANQMVAALTQSMPSSRRVKRQLNNCMNRFRGTRRIGRSRRLSSNHRQARNLMTSSIRTRDSFCTSVLCFKGRNKKKSIVAKSTLATRHVKNC